jgi:hypothetical protein
MQEPPPEVEWVRLPLPFVPNVGQSDPAVSFQAHSSGGTLFFTPEEVVLSIGIPWPEEIVPLPTAIPTPSYPKASWAR